MEIQVTGTPGGDNECWVFVVSDDEYRRLVGEDRYVEDLTDLMRFYDEVQELGMWQPPFSHKEWRLYPEDLIRLAGHDDSNGNITLRLSVDKV